VSVWIVNGAYDRLAVDLEGDRRAEDRNAMRVVRRPVNGIEDPAVCRPRASLPHFFRQDVVTGKALRNQRAEHPFDLEVDLSHEIDFTFFVDAHL
jgi:hypothetical protein